MKISVTLTRRHWILWCIVYFFQLLTSSLYLIGREVTPSSLGFSGAFTLLMLLFPLAIFAMISAVVIIDLLEVFRKEPKRYIQWEHD